ncbi:MAG: protein kinase [Candidatus Hodarchaeota archaeon]
MAEQDDNSLDIVLDEAVQEFLASGFRGEEPNLDEFVKQYPGLEQQIRRKIRDCQRVSSLFDSLREADESEFEEAAAGCELVGRKIGGFEIVEMIGSGGMGFVYLARDTRLDRSVAIKTMPPELMDNATARTRFQREAKLLASLSHPNIGVIHDIIEQTQSSAYLVLEYVSGRTLAERITKGPLKLQEALTIALQIAEAVAAAHEHDVIHRDLKPGNIKITFDGRIKVLDFGLAKTVSDESSEKPATTTEPGKIIGTPAYMSPEQARGKPADKRSDIWSFGCILYEMLTGHLPFEGRTATDTLARIIERQPDWEALPQETPTNIRTLLRHCLEKDPHRRLQHIGDAAIEINDTLNKSATAAVRTKTAKSRKVAMIIGVVAVGIILFVIISKFFPEKEIQPSPKEIRLVVLPFENLGSTKDDYFVEGMTDEITSRLAVIHGLGVISRNSAMQYKNKEKSTPQIAEELRLDYILLGTVQRERPSDPNSQVRIRLKLIKAAEDIHIWTQNYDKNMSNIFRLQSDVAEQVAQALDIILLEPERQALASRPTENIEAYDYYLKGNIYYNRSYLKSDLSMAIQMYEKAVELDPMFTLAYARLSRSHVFMYHLFYDRSEERLALAEQAIDKAVKLNPDLPEVHVALGWYYYQGYLDYNRALKEFAIARKSQPKNSDLLLGIGAVQRRQGKFDQAVDNMQEAADLDPLSPGLMEQVGQTFALMRKYPQAERYFNRSILLDPSVPTPYTWKAMLYIWCEGKPGIEKARAVLEEARQNMKPKENRFMHTLSMYDVFDRKYQQALDRLSLRRGGYVSQFYFIPKALPYAQIYRSMGNNKKAKEHFEQAKDILESKIAEDPQDARVHSSLGIAYAGLGRKVDAIREGELAVKLLPVSKEAWRGIFPLLYLAEIYVMVGEYDKAIDKLKELLSKPGIISRPLLRLEPKWDSLREHPRFINLLESGNLKNNQSKRSQFPPK